MIDPGDGLLKEVKQHEVTQKRVKDWHGHFVVGELLPWKGWWLEIVEVDETGIKLKPRKQTDKQIRCSKL